MNNAVSVGDSLLRKDFDRFAVVIFASTVFQKGVARRRRELVILHPHLRVEMADDRGALPGVCKLK